MLRKERSRKVSSVVATQSTINHTSMVWNSVHLLESYPLHEKPVSVSLLLVAPISASRMPDAWVGESWLRSATSSSETSQNLPSGSRGDGHGRVVDDLKVLLQNRRQIGRQGAHGRVQAAGGLQSDRERENESKG